MKKGNLLYEGKAKKLFETDDPSILLVEYKDSLTAFNAQKKSSLPGKGTLNNRISANLLAHVASEGVPNHFISLIDDTRQTVRKVRIIPLEVVIRNITTGSLCKRLGIEEGIELVTPLLEFYLKDDALGDPIVTVDHIRAFGWATDPEIEKLREISRKVNSILKKRFLEAGIVLVDFKLEFGRTDEGEVILADEISPDTCRLWDFSSGEKMDKDRFRKDLGNVLEAYAEVWRRLSGEVK
ncbi:MAG TPA: phosphoribosylaminoimidazolesuccinocarboxamide synthase [Synergistales bacterium]|nr:phosphoribosylaminoimidazolesuccinocarboxamide synthase [Synergistales bacterium]HRV70741.1 phosphoribosylaminoimidazolesuccinocarboxamide synthase [Thermovirgaceae bacterium]